MAEAVALHLMGDPNASFRNLAKAAGVSVATLRHYFGTHEALLLAALAESQPRLRAAMASAGENARSGPSAVSEIAEAVAAGLDGPFGAVLWAYLVRGVPRDAKESAPGGIDPLVTLVQAQLERVRDQTGIVEPEAIAEVLVALCLGEWLLAKAEGRRFRGRAASIDGYARSLGQVQIGAARRAPGWRKPRGTR